MARYIGIVKGARGSESRLGHATSGLTVKANGWRLGATVWIGPGADGEDEIRVTLTDGSGQAGLFSVVGVYTRKDLDKLTNKPQ